MSTIADPDVDTLVEAVRSCPSISDIVTVQHPVTGPTGGDATRTGSEAGTPMISYDDDSVDISVIAFYGHSVPEVFEQVERAVRPLIGTRHLTVTVDDLDTGDDTPRPRTPVR